MRRVLSVIAAAVAAFFVFYTVRLLVVTRGLTAIRAGGRGAYAGAIVFPVLAIVLGWAAWRLWRPTSGTVARDARERFTSA
jgi:hypothetical protein